jgi:hypothetical protein
VKYAFGGTLDQGHISLSRAQSGDKSSKRANSRLPPPSSRRVTEVRHRCYWRGRPMGRGQHFFWSWPEGVARIADRSGSRASVHQKHRRRSQSTGSSGGLQLPAVASAKAAPFKRYDQMLDVLIDWPGDIISYSAQLLCRYFPTALRRVSTLRSSARVSSPDISGKNVSTTPCRPTTLGRDSATP